MNVKILVISDSHGLNNNVNKVLEYEQADYVFHAGDYTTNLKFMKDHFDLFVDGNNDFQYEDIQTIKIGKFQFLIIHGHQCYSFNKEK